MPQAPTTKKHRIFGPATGGAMTASGGGATEYFDASGAPGNPIADRLAREGQLQPGSPMVIPSPSGQPGLYSRDKNGNVVVTASGSAPAPPSTSAPSSPSFPTGGGLPSGGGGFGGGGGQRHTF